MSQIVRICELPRPRPHSAMIGEKIIAGEEQFSVGYDAMFRHVLEKGATALDITPPALLGRDFRSGWDSAAMLIRALGVSDHVPFPLALSKE